MADQDVRKWALKGAEQRLVEIAEEAAQIYATFPELRDRGAAGSVPGGRRGRARKVEAAGERAAPAPTPQNVPGSAEAHQRGSEGAVGEAEGGEEGIAVEA